MSDAEAGSKRKAASEIDATAVAPKKKFLAAQAEAAATATETGAGSSTPRSHGNAPAVTLSSQQSGLSTVSEASAVSAWSGPPAGAFAADSEDVLREQNVQLYAAFQARQSDIARLQKEVQKLEAHQQSCTDSIVCVYRHWSMLSGELRSTFNRLEYKPMDKSPPAHAAVFESMLQKLVPAEMDAGLVAGCTATQELMQEVVQALMDNNARYQQVLCDMKEKVGDDKVKAELGKLKKQLDAGEKSLDQMRARVRELELDEAKLKEDARKAHETIQKIQELLAETKSMNEILERRLIKNEEKFKYQRDQAASQGQAAMISRNASELGSTEAGFADTVQAQDLERKLNDYKQQAESRLEEIKGLRKEIVELQHQNLNSSDKAQDMSEKQVKESAVFKQLEEKLKTQTKECQSFHICRISQLSADIVECQNKVIQQQSDLEQLYEGQKNELIKKWKDANESLLKANQEIKTLQTKMEEKSSNDGSTLRADEFEKMLKTLQGEYKRLKNEHDLLKQKPDAEDVRRAAREAEEKIAKERDIEKAKAEDLAEQLKNKDKHIALLKKEKSNGEANGVNGADSLTAKELESVKKELEALRSEKKELTRRWQKADRGFNDLNKLFRTANREKETLTQDLDSLAPAFEDMQEQNQRLLDHIKSKEEEQNELVRQRMKEKQQREMMQEEKAALKEKLMRAEELMKQKDEVIEKSKQDVEQVRQELTRRKKDEDEYAKLLQEHQKALQSKTTAAKEAKSELEKMRQDHSDKKKKDIIQALADAQFDNKRLQEELGLQKARIQQLEKQPRAAAAEAAPSSGPDLSNLLNYYRSRIKCHCRQEDKSRILPCGHGLCQKCVEGLIKDRSRKCPACAKKFDHSDVRPLFLQGAVDETL